MSFSGFSLISPYGWEYVGIFFVINALLFLIFQIKNKTALYTLLIYTHQKIKWNIIITVMLHFTFCFSVVSN